jgi:hypothetical protein
MIHIPKTGGNFCRAAIVNQIRTKEIGSRHCSIDKCYNENKLSFSFVRNPLDWLKSKWSYAIRTGAMSYWYQKRRETPDSTSFQIQCFYKDFQKFVEKYLEFHPDVIEKGMFVRLGYEKKNNNEWTPTKTIVDFVGKNENLREDLITALDLAKEQFDPEKIRLFPEKNVTSRSGKWNCEYTSELKDKVIEANKYLIDKFDYWDYL